LQAVSTVIETLEKQGYRFVSAQEMFQADFSEPVIDNE